MAKQVVKWETEDGIQWASQDAAEAHERSLTLETRIKAVWTSHVEASGYNNVSRFVVLCWGKLKTIMEPDEPVNTAAPELMAKLAQASGSWNCCCGYLNAHDRYECLKCHRDRETGEETPHEAQARLEARRKRVAEADRQPHTGRCTCLTPPVATRYDEATGCEHCTTCGGLYYTGTHEAQDKPANPPNSRRVVSEKGCMSCGHQYIHRKDCTSVE